MFQSGCTIFNVSFRINTIFESNLRAKCNSITQVLKIPLMNKTQEVIHVLIFNKKNETLFLQLSLHAQTLSIL